MICFYLSLTLNGVHSVAEVQEKVREEAAKETRAPWILGIQFDDQALVDRSRITRYELDTTCVLIFFRNPAQHPGNDDDNNQAGNPGHRQG